MRTLIGLLPLAVGLAVFGALVWFMVERDMVLGTWLLAAFLVGHGLVHLMFAAPPPAAAARTAGRAAVDYPFDLQRSWLVTIVHLDQRLVRGVGMALVVSIVGGYLLAGLSTVGLVVAVTWWPVLVVASTIGSLALLALDLAPGLALGVAIDVALLWLAIVATWTP
jgi:hypothetical protein